MASEVKRWWVQLIMGGDYEMREAPCPYPEDPLYVLASDYDTLREELAAEKRRFEEHLDAWRANNEAHAKRIAELERELKNLAPVGMFNGIDIYGWHKRAMEAEKPAKCPRTHEAAYQFWKTYHEQIEKRGNYESTWAAIDAALAAKGK